MHKHTARKLDLKSQLLPRLSDLIQQLGLSHKELAKAIRRNRSTIEAWLDPGESAVPDWVDLCGLQECARKNGLTADFFALVGQRREHHLRMVLPARTGTLAAVLVQLFHEGGSVLRLAVELDREEREATVDLTTRLSGSVERLVADLEPLVQRRQDGSACIEILREE